MNTAKNPPSFELPDDLPPEQLHVPRPEERLDAFAELIAEARKNLSWTPRLDDLLVAFESFLTDRPSPPPEWQQRLGVDASKFDYWQIVLPSDYLDPYEDDLGNVRLLREKFHGEPSFMALEHALISRNLFLFRDGHAKPEYAPKPLVMLESRDEDDQVDWDCCIQIFPDGSYYAYNLENDDEESLGEDIHEILETEMKVLSRLQITIPKEGSDYGYLE